MTLVAFATLSAALTLAAAVLRDAGLRQRVRANLTR